jgi:Na+/melibiose symporter-like transporter
MVVSTGFAVVLGVVGVVLAGIGFLWRGEFIATRSAFPVAGSLLCATGYVVLVLAQPGDGATTLTEYAFGGFGVALGAAGVYLLFLGLRHVRRQNEMPGTRN